MKHFIYASATHCIPRLTSVKNSPQSTGESERNEYCYRYHDNAWAGGNLYGSGAGGEDVRGGDFRNSYGAGAGDDFYSYVWDFDDIDGCDDDKYEDYYDEYGGDWF
jgi:hypothetical protein